VKNGILSLTSAAADFADARRFFPFILFCGNPRHLRIKEAKAREVHNPAKNRRWFFQNKNASQDLLDGSGHVKGDASAVESHWLA
jgi:hypothetical protein